MDTCSEDSCNNNNKASLRSQSKCEQDFQLKNGNQNPLYPFSMSIYDHQVGECAICQNCSLSETGEIKFCPNEENVCQVIF